jgi:putative ABC transport system permease protein
METLLQDIRFGLRQLRKAPGFTLAAVLTLAIGIGATTAIFSVVHGVLLKPPPFRDPEKLVFIWEASPSHPEMSVTLPSYGDWKEHSRSFSEMGAFRSSSYDLGGVQEPERLTARLVSATLLPMLGVQPLLGRNFTPEEDTLGGPPAVMLTHGFWTRRYGADRGIVGQSITLSGIPHTVVGVLPERFAFFSPRDIWVPLSRTPAELFTNRGSHPGLYVVARLKEGVSLEQARADMEGVGKAMAAAHPDQQGSNYPKLMGLQAYQTRDVAPSLLALMAAVAGVLLIAAINVANLLLARGAVRGRELTIRAALGAGRGRLVRQLLAESALLALCGGVFGTVLAAWAVDALAGARPDSIPSTASFRIDGVVLGFTLLTSLAVGVLLGILPALRGSQVQLAAALQATQAAARRFRHRARDGLVVAEVALALVLLVGAGLLLRTFVQLQGADPGYKTSGLLTLSLSTPQTRFPDSRSVRAFTAQVQERVAAAPGVAGVAFAQGIPMAGFSESSFDVAGRPPAPPGQGPQAAMFLTSSNYFEVMGTPLLEGRGFQPSDVEGSAPVAVVDEVTAKRLFPQGALGQRLSMGAPGEKAFTPEIVGVARHVVAYGPGEPEPSPMQVYLVLNQLPEEFFGWAGRDPQLAVRARSGTAEALTSLVRQEVAAVDREQVLGNVRSMEGLLAESLGQRRFVLALVAFFGLAALLLAAIGIYSVMSYVVAQRTQEMGIRIALGAKGGDILRLVVGHGARLAGVGLLVGVLGALGATRLLGSLLSGVSATDPLTYLAVGAALGGVALVACWVPARRAVRVDPVTSLRAD